MADDDENRRELVQKVKQLVTRKFGDTSDRALAELFSEYDANNDGRCTRPEVERLLADAGIGNEYSRAMWTTGVLELLDVDRDDGISLPELTHALATQAAPPAVPSGLTLSAEDALNIAHVALVKPASVDLSNFSAEDLAAIEQAKQLLAPSLGTFPVPKLPAPLPKPQPGSPAASAKPRPKKPAAADKADDMLQQVAVGLVVAVACVWLTRRM